jgi:hypothetical protein
VATPAYPNINGVAPDWAQIRVSISDHGRTLGLKGIDYSDKMSREKVRGEGALPMELTEGEYDAECSLTMNFREARKLQDSLRAKADSLGIPLYNLAFSITVLYRLDSGAQLIQDTIEGCKIQSFENSHEQGSKGLEVKIPVDCMRIKWNGVYYARSAQEDGGL